MYLINISKIQNYQKSIIIAIVIIIVLIVIFLYIRKCIKAERRIKREKEQLEREYSELEKAFQQVNYAQKELSKKYEELKKTEERNKKVAFEDNLTTLPNRVAFTEQLDNTMLTLRKEETIAVMYIDLDNFKNINDSLGHSYGDELLMDVTERIKQALDSNDYLARFGGDEFVILSQNIEDIGLYEEKIKRIQKVFTFPFSLAMREFFITTSIGVAFAPKDGKTTQTIIKNVDLAMYAAKGMGRNTYCFYDEVLNQKLMDKIELQSELRTAIEKEEFLVYYQAQIDLQTNKIVGFEALIRWNHPEKGLILPDKFIPIAEETGLIIPIGEYVLRKACKQLKCWEEEGYKNIHMAVNLSARQFRDVELVQTIEKIIAETGILPSSLELEITETIALDDIAYSIETIKQLKEIGIQFSLDDFGVGYSSMNYLKYLPINNLKIDKSFLDSVMESKSDQTIVSTIITLAQTLNLSVIAEGVEYDAQELFLKRSHCNRAQGYLYSRPIPENEVMPLLKQHAINTLE